MTNFKVAITESLIEFVGILDRFVNVAVYSKSQQEKLNHLFFLSKRKKVFRSYALLAQAESGGIPSFHSRNNSYQYYTDYPSVQATLSAFCADLIGLCLKLKVSQEMYPWSSNA